MSYQSDNWQHKKEKMSQHNLHNTESNGSNLMNVESGVEG